MTFLKDIFTSKDGESFNFAKVIGVIILVLFVLGSFYSYVVKGSPFDPVTWGGVMTGIYGAINAAVRATHVTEPDQ